MFADVDVGVEVEAEADIEAEIEVEAPSEARVTSLEEAETETGLRVSEADEVTSVAEATKGVLCRAEVVAEGVAPPDQWRCLCESSLSFQYRLYTTESRSWTQTTRRRTLAGHKCPFDRR